LDLTYKKTINTKIMALINPHIKFKGNSHDFSAGGQIEGQIGDSRVKV
jgi:hypothetical protein